MEKKETAKDKTTTAAKTTQNTGDKQKPERMTRFTAYLGGSLFTNQAIAAFTFVLAFVAIYQYFAMNSQLDIMRKDERAWLRVTYDSVPLQINSANIGTMHLINIGKTPARSIASKIAVEILPAGSQPDLEFGNAIQTYSANIMFPSPSIEKVWDFTVKRIQAPPLPIHMIGRTKDFPISQPELDAFNAGRTYIVVFSRLTYRDTFGDHWTQACFYYVSDAAAWKFSVNAKPCSDYNDADTE